MDTDFLLIMLVFILGLIVGLVVTYYFVSDVNVYNELLKLEVSVQQVSDLSSQADLYYEEASFAYENEEWNLVESNCRLARDKYSEHAQKIRVIREGITDKEEIFNIYKDMLTEHVEIDNNMYEACEHFESAARYYKIYYSPNTPYDDSSYDMGTGEIDAMNEKIDAHDDAVERYNTLLSKYELELQSLL